MNNGVKENMILHGSLLLGMIMMSAIFITFFIDKFIFKFNEALYPFYAVGAGAVVLSIIVSELLFKSKLGNIRQATSTEEIAEKYRVAMILRDAPKEAAGLINILICTFFEANILFAVGALTIMFLFAITFPTQRNMEKQLKGIVE